MINTKLISVLESRPSFEDIAGGYRKPIISCLKKLEAIEKIIKELDTQPNDR